MRRSESKFRAIYDQAPSGIGLSSSAAHFQGGVLSSFDPGLPVVSVFQSPRKDRLMHLKDLKKKTPAELVAMAEEAGVEGASTLRKRCASACACTARRRTRS